MQPRNFIDIGCNKGERSTSQRLGSRLVLLRRWPMAQVPTRLMAMHTPATFLQGT